MKKQYMKPSMKVYEMQSHVQILAGSNYPPDWNGPISYTPGSDEMNKLA
jgi:hypothetical protein